MYKLKQIKNFAKISSYFSETRCYEHSIELCRSDWPNL
jgi:hypothetical protein